MKQLIEDIHNNDFFGAFIEVGCGTPVASNLFSVSGASKTVFFTESPYNKEYLAEKYKSPYRSVSAETVKLIAETTSKKYPQLNTIYVASFQIGEHNNISTHGWIYFKYHDTEKIFHVSIHEPLTREEYIDKIGKIGINIIHSQNNNCAGQCVDIVINKDFTYDYERTLRHILYNDDEIFSVFSPNRIDRLESITRDVDKLVIFKGSFNPVSNSHKEIYDICKSKYNKNIYFMISFNAIQKGMQQIDSMLFRIKCINKLGYSVIICKNPKFKENIDFLRYKFTGDIVLAMGLDTINRLFDDYKTNTLINFHNLKKDFPKVNFLIFNRAKYLDIFVSTISSFGNEITFIDKMIFSELSSTTIRNYIKEGKIEDVKKLVPEEIFTDVLKEFKC